MKNKLVVILLILMFALALGAGVVAGKLSTRAATPETPAPKRGTLPQVLQLTADQRDKMEAIWEDVRQTSNKRLAEATAIQRQQDDALMAMLTDDQKKKWQDINMQTAGKIAVLDGSRKEAFKKAVDATLKLLNENQRKIYTQIIKDRVGDLPDSTWQQP
jgi:hypothetical protein